MNKNESEFVPRSREIEILVDKGCLRSFKKKHVKSEKNKNISEYKNKKSPLKAAFVVFKLSLI